VNPSVTLVSRIKGELILDLQRGFPWFFHCNSYLSVHFVRLFFQILPKDYLLLVDFNHKLLELLILHEVECLHICVDVVLLIASFIEHSVLHLTRKGWCNHLLDKLLFNSCHSHLCEFELVVKHLHLYFFNIL
jgi:hypothetical protein